MTATNGLAGRREWTGLAVLLLPTLVLAMDMGVLFFAVPFIATDLHPSGTQQLWIMDMYSFLLAGLLIPMGALGDRIGRRKLLMAGTAGFAAASLVAAYADGAAQLIAARALLGIFGAVFGPSTLALIRTTFHDPKQRQAAIGAWSGMMMAGVTLGPVVGGLLLDHFWWGSAFLPAVPLMLVTLVAAPFVLPEQRAAERTGRFDLLGAALSMATVLPVVYGIKTLAVEGWSPLAALVLAAGLAVGAGLVVRLRTAANPLVDLGLFRIRTFSGAITVNTIAMFAMIGFTLFTSQYLQLVKGLSPLSASLWALLPSLGVGAAVGGFGALAGKVRPAILLTTGFLISAAGFALITQIGPDTPMAAVLVAAGVIAAGSVGTITITADMVVSAAPADRAGAAGATSETAQELGGSLGIAILGAAGAAIYRTRLDGQLPAGVTGEAASAARDTLGGAATVAAQLGGETAERLMDAARVAFADGMHVAAAVGVVFMVAAALTANRLMRHLPPAGAERPADEPKVLAA